MAETKRGSFSEVFADLDTETLDAMEVEQMPDDYSGTPEKEPEAKEETEPETEETEEVEEDTEEGEEESEEEVTEEGEETSEEEEEDTEEGEEGEVDIADALEDNKEVVEEDDTPLSFTVKVDGKERDVDEEELVRGYQTARSSTKRFSEAKKLHTEAQTFFKKFLSDPGTAMTDYMVKQAGGDRVKARNMVRDSFLEFLAPDLEESMIEDERERELHRQKREIEEKQRELDRQTNEAKASRDAVAEEEFISDLRLGIEGQIKKLKLPSTKNEVIWEQAGKLLDAAKSTGSTNEELLELVPTVMKNIKEERIALAKRYALSLSEDEFEETHTEQLKVLKKKRIKKVKDKKSMKKKGIIKTEPKAKKKASEKQYYKSDEVFGSINLDDFDD